MRFTVRHFAIRRRKGGCACAVSIELVRRAEFHELALGIGVELAALQHARQAERDDCLCRAVRRRQRGRVFARHGLSAHAGDRKSTRLNSSHGSISYAVFCLKKKKKTFNLSCFRKKKKKIKTYK